MRKERKQVINNFFVSLSKLWGTNEELKELEDIQKLYFSDISIYDKNIRKIKFDIEHFHLDLNQIITCLKSMTYLEHNGFCFKKIRNNYYQNYQAGFCFFTYNSYLQKYSEYASLYKKLYNQENFIQKKYPVFVEKELETILNKLEVKDKKIIGIFNNIYLENKYLEKEITFENETYSFVIPKTLDEVRKEASSLKICIAARYKQYMKKELIYVFMRNKKDISKSYASIIIDAYTKKVMWAITEFHKNLEGNDKKVLDLYLKTTDIIF